MGYDGKQGRQNVKKQSYEANVDVLYVSRKFALSVMLWLTVGSESMNI